MARQLAGAVLAVIWLTGVSNTARAQGDSLFEWRGYVLGGTRYEQTEVAGSRSISISLGGEFDAVWRPGRQHLLRADVWPLGSVHAGNGEDFVEQLFWQYSAPRLALTVGRYNSPLGVEQKGFEERLVFVRAGITRERAPNLNGVMLAAPVTRYARVRLMGSFYPDNQGTSDEYEGLSGAAQLELGDGERVALTLAGLGGRRRWGGAQDRWDHPYGLMVVNATVRPTSRLTLAAEYASFHLQNRPGNWMNLAAEPDRQWNGYLALAKFEQTPWLNWAARYDVLHVEEYSTLDQQSVSVESVVRIRQVWTIGLDLSYIMDEQSPAQGGSSREQRYEALGVVTFEF